MKNNDIFMSGEGDAWFTRNARANVEPEKNESLLLSAWKRLPFIPKRVLEIGCSSGYNLQSLMERYPPPHTQQRKKFILWN